MRRAWGRDRKIAVLIAYGAAVVALALVALWRQAQLVHEIWRLGDPGMTLQRAEDDRGFRVTAVGRGSAAARVLRVGDRVLRVGDVSEWVYPLSDVWSYRHRPVRPGQVAPVLLERGGRAQTVELRFGRGAVLSKQFGPGSPPFGL